MSGGKIMYNNIVYNVAWTLYRKVTPLVLDLKGDGLKFTNLNSVDIFKAHNGIGINLIFNKEPNINEFKKLDIFRDKVCYINYTYLDKNAFIPIIQNNILTLKLDDYIIDLPNSFFMQATLESQDHMINTIKNEIK